MTQPIPILDTTLNEDIASNSGSNTKEEVSPR